MLDKSSLYSLTLNQGKIAMNDNHYWQDLIQSVEQRLRASLLHTGKPESITETLVMSDDELQIYLESKLAAHRAQRGVVLA